MTTVEVWFFVVVFGLTAGMSGWAVYEVVMLIREVSKRRPALGSSTIDSSRGVN